MIVEFALPTATDEIASLSASLQRRFRGRVRALEVSRDGNELVVRGQTRTYYLKQLVQHAVMNLSRLPIRANEIVVD